MKNKPGTTNSILLVLAGVLAFAGCSKKEPAEEQPAASSPGAAPAATPIDPATAATVSGTVKFDGVAPKPAKIDMSQDPNCKGTNTAETVVVADGKLAEGQVWRQESIVGSIFEGSIEVLDGVVYPTIQGEAYVTAEATLILDPADPFAKGIRA